jgi:hypothetical protein
VKDLLLAIQEENKEIQQILPTAAKTKRHRMEIKSKRLVPVICGREIRRMAEIVASAGQKSERHRPRPCRGSYVAQSEAGLICL